MNVKLLRQFGQRLLTPYGSQGHLRFESRRVVPAWSSAHRFSCSAAILADVRQKLHLSNLFKNPEPALCSVAALLAMASLPASANPLGAGTRAAVPPEAPLLQVAQCQQVYRLQGRHYVPSVICSPYHPYLMGPLPLD